MESYVVIDGVENDIFYVKTEDEAKAKLKEIFESSIEGGEWMEGIENSFIAKITSVINQKEIKEPEDYSLSSGISKWYDMEIKDV